MMSWIDEPDNDFPCMLTCAEDQWESIEMKLQSLAADSVDLPSGKTVPQLIFEARECSVCNQDGEHAVPFWAMRALREELRRQKKRSGWVNLSFSRTILPNGHNHMSFRLE